MKTSDFLLQLLRSLESWVPPEPGKHHAITAARYGSDADGWEPKLALRIDGQVLFLDDDDFDKPVETLVAEIVSLLKETSYA